MSDIVVPESDSLLDQLCAEYAALESDLAPMTAREKELKEAIKHELGKYIAEGETEVGLNSPYLGRRRLVAKDAMRFQTEAFKQQYLELYVRFTKKSRSWNFEKVK